jgi:hypothetical protein
MKNYDCDRMGQMRIERLIACAPRELWHALIRETELGQEGAFLRLALPSGVSSDAAKITAYQSGRMLECRCASGVLRWELHPRMAKTLLVFTHAEGAGQWLACLDGLAALATEVAASI